MDISSAIATFPEDFGSGNCNVDSEDGESETEVTRAMVAMQNKKKKKSGGFQSMGFCKAVFSGIMKKGYKVPTPIQRKCIPLILDGKDVVAMARTGSGKTAAFLLPLYESLKTHSTKIGVRAVILSPTRELASQTFKFFKELGRFTGLRGALVLGGDSIEEQFSAIHQNPDVIIGTPGRFLHLCVEMDLVLTSVQYVVFDEADRLFELGFAEQLQDIIRRLPDSRQTLLFSATLPRMLVEFAKAGLRDPVLVRLDVDSKLSENLRMAFLSVRAEDKVAALLHLLQSQIPDNQQTVVFTATKHHVEYLREVLDCAGVSCTYIYSSLDQTARKINVAKFVNKKTNTLLVTDVAARGIDIPSLDNVINYNFPAKSKLFVHRVGRVARAGRSGCAYSLVAPDEVAYMIDLHMFLGKPLQYGQQYGDRDGVFGSIPQSILDDEEDVLSHGLSTSPDLADLKRVSENAQKQYVRSRNQPAPESIKRAKQLPIPLPLHPMFLGDSHSDVVHQHQLMDSLRHYKPSQTIFEVHSTAKGVAKDVMKSKRQVLEDDKEHHCSVITANKLKQDRSVSRPEAPEADQAELVHHVDDDDVIVTFQTEQSAKQDLDKKSKRRKQRAAAAREHYIHYQPKDHHSEQGLSLGASAGFDAQASTAVLDLDGDDDQSMRRAKSSNLRWDRKRKKFVGPSSEEQRKSKRIKTESGQWIKASYKSDVYQKWKDKHKIEGRWAGEEEEEAGLQKHRGLGRMQKRFQRGKKGNAQSGGKKRREAGDLKPKSLILQKRRRKQVMEERKKLKKKKDSSQSRDYKGKKRRK